jgi:3-deoxy-7-phosphoheptulonate synthase
MIVLMKSDSTVHEVERVNEKIRSLGFVPHVMNSSQRTTIGITGNKDRIDSDLFLSLSGVGEVVQVTKPYKLVSREIKADDTIINVGGDEIGGKELAIIAGPCSVESRSQVREIAHMLSEMGVRFLRGGAYKPRTSPYSFQGLKEEGLEYLKEAAVESGMHIITEVKDTETLSLVSRYADILQVGSRNMYNFSLLERIGELRKPVLLKRAFSATIEELLMAGEYVASKGNYQIIFCERGIRSFESLTRNTLDLNAVPLVKKLSHFPIIVDPSHGTGSWDLVIPMAQAAIVAGADGLMIEVHSDPSAALSDGFQSLRPDKFKRLLERLSELAPVVNRSLPVGMASIPIATH